MPLDPRLLRRLFVAIGVAVLLAVVVFYSYAKYRQYQVVKEIPKKLGIEIQQSTQGFTFSKSEGGRTIFTISASNGVQYKAGGRAVLNNVRIIVFGRSAQELPGGGTDRYDQIYGKSFEYDQPSGEVTAQGDVMIDLDQKGKPSADPLDTQPQPGSIHVRTSGLNFNQKTGIAQTKETIEFSFPQASGSAHGAVYDSRQMTLALQSAVRVKFPPGPGKPDSAASLEAEKAEIIDRPLRAKLTSVRLQQGPKEVQAGEVMVTLKDDNTADRVLATGGVIASAKGGSPAQLRASQAELAFAAENRLRNAVFSGNVTFDSSGKTSGRGSAGRIVAEFQGKNELQKVRASQNVVLEQVPQGRAGAKVQTTRLDAEQVDFFLRGGALQHAETAGKASITQSDSPSARTVLTADKLEATFAGNRLRRLVGDGDAKVVASAAGQTDRVTTSRQFTADFAASGAAQSLTGVVQQGDFAYQEGNRAANAERAAFNPAAEVFSLTGSPRIQDKDQGFALTADAVTLNRKSKDAAAQGNVKTTYIQPKTATDGALFSSAEPIHVTSQSATLSNNRELAQFRGGARLWQGANIIQAPSIDFQRSKKALIAHGAEGKREVQTVFLETSRTGRQTPITLTAGRMDYSDQDRKALFSGGVTAAGSEMTVSASQMEVMLLAKGQNRQPAGSAGQLERIIATGNIRIEEQKPARTATGERLEYTAADGKFVLTGSPGKFPSIFDAEQGNITGDSLTFFSRDDRVQIGSGENTRTVTRTRFKDAKKP